MPKNEKTGATVRKIASKALKGAKLTKAELLSLAASALTQSPDKPKRKVRR